MIDSPPQKILIVEDAMPMAKTLALKFEYDGFTVRSVYDGNEALAILKQESFDVILLDLIMPNLDGFMVMEEMKKIANKTPVFVLTNLSQDEDKKKLEVLGAQAFFVKSDISMQAVVDRVKSFLAKSQ